MREVTLLWALRSPCNLGCRYCYFGTIEEHRLQPPIQLGQLSHLSRGDLPFADIAGFLSTIGDSAVRRVFLAGGEPLIWPHTLDIIETLTTAGVQVVVCTNGIPLIRPEITNRLIDLKVDAVSVSLDSADPAANDQYRPSRNEIHGWADVVNGVRTLLTARGDRPRPRVGIYTVLTRRNLAGVRHVAALGAELGVDYLVPQPISLAPDHPLAVELGLRAEDAATMAVAFEHLHDAALPIRLPDPTYAAQVVDSITTTQPRFVRRCFGGDTLFFIEPDGQIFDCPSSLKIAATPAEHRRSIRGRNAAELFGSDRRTSPQDCALGSRDCVNMWPLMGFDRFLQEGNPCR